MIAEIPAELGTLIPDRIKRLPCSQCGREEFAVLIALDDEGLCNRCYRDEQIVGMQAARDAVRELVVPIERQREALPRFGTGSGEIESCDLVLTMRHEQEVNRDASICRRLLAAFFGFEALLLILAAAAMS